MILLWCWLMQIDAHWDWLMLINADWCRLMLICTDWCWLMLTDADWCWLMLIDMTIAARIRFNQVFFCLSIPSEFLQLFLNKGLNIPPTPSFRQCLKRHQFWFGMASPNCLDTVKSVRTDFIWRFCKPLPLLWIIFPFVLKLPACSDITLVFCLKSCATTTPAAVLFWPNCSTLLSHLSNRSLAAVEWISISCQTILCSWHSQSHALVQNLLIVSSARSSLRSEDTNFFWIS